MSIEGPLFPGFTTPPNDPSREIRPRFTIERHPEEQDRLDDDEDYDDAGCNECGGSGLIITCIDDICHGIGYCMHGDGDRACRCGRNPML